MAERKSDRTYEPKGTGDTYQCAICMEFVSYKKKDVEEHVQKEHG